MPTGTTGRNAFGKLWRQLTGRVARETAAGDCCCMKCGGCSGIPPTLTVTLDSISVCASGCYPNVGLTRSTNLSGGGGTLSGTFELEYTGAGDYGCNWEYLADESGMVATYHDVDDTCFAFPVITSTKLRVVVGRSDVGGGAGVWTVIVSLAGYNLIGQLTDIVELFRGDNSGADAGCCALASIGNDLASCSYAFPRPIAELGTGGTAEVDAGC